MCPPMRGNAAAGNFNEPIVLPRPTWFQHLNPCENAIATFYAGVVIQPHQVAEIIRRGLCFSQVMPFPI